MGIPLTIPAYLRAWERAPEAPCPHDTEKPCVPCLHRRLHNRRWSEKNQDRRRELVRDAARRMREKDPEGWRAYAKGWRDANKPKIAAQNCRRRGRVLGSGLVETVVPAEVYEACGGRCHLCGLQVPRETACWSLRATIDHLIPLVRGGSHTRENVALAHFVCNCTKKERLTISEATRRWLRRRVAKFIISAGR